jgi:hypothetical protein
VAGTARAILIAAATLVPVLVAMFGAEYLTDVEDEIAWRERSSPFHYIERGQGGRYLPQAQEELEREQRQIGLITRLFRDSGRVQILQASFFRDEDELVAASNVAIGRWNTLTGQRTGLILPPSGATAAERKEWGTGIAEAVITQSGGRVTALTLSGGKALWSFDGITLSDRLRLEGDSYERLVSSGSTVAVIRNRQEVLWIDLASRRITPLPHAEVGWADFAPDGDLVTFSRREIMRWRDAQLRHTLRLPDDVANAGPMPGALSADGQMLLIPVGASLEVWDAATASRRFAVRHEFGRGGFCASSNWIATGGEDGRVQLWSARSGAPGRSFRAHATGVQSLLCSETRLLSIGDSGWDARLWDLSGSLNPEPVEPLPNQREHPAWVKLGADARLPERFPALADLLWSSGEQLKLAGLGGLMFWCCAVYWWFRRDIDQ